MAKIKIFAIKFLKFLTFFALFYAILALFIAFLDPFKILNAKSNGEKFYNNMQASIPNIVKNYDFNAIILGSSMFENTSANEAQKFFRSKAPKIRKSFIWWSEFL